MQDDRTKAANTGTANPARTSVGLAIVMMVATGCLLATMDSFAKHLTQSYPLLLVVWARYVFHTVPTFAVLALRRRSFDFLKSNRPGLQLLRASLLAVSTACTYAALRVLPLADVTAVVFLAPIFVTALAAPLLGERVRGHHWVGVGAGFAGVLLVVRPGSGVTDWTAALPLVAAAGVSLYMILTRMLAGQDRIETTTFYSTAVGAVVLSVLALLVWVTPDLAGWMAMAAMGTLGAVGHMLFIKAFQVAPAALLSPFVYSQLIASVGLGIVVFGEAPSLWMLSGAVLIVGGGLYAWHRDRR